MTATAQKRLHFLGWSRPVLDLVGEYLLRDWHDGYLDLSTLLVIVPTRQSGRRLRLKLAELAAERGTGVLPPRVVQPDFLLHPAVSEANPATGAEMLAVFAQLLQGATLPGELPSLFPTKPLEQTRQWALQIAEQLCDLRRLLGENGLSLAQARDRLTDCFDDPGQWDPERWHDLARLESLYLQQLEKWHREDPVAAAARTAQDPALPPEIQRVLLAATPDPIPLLLDALERVARTIPVDICVHAPPELGEEFDEWGRPRPDVWIDPSLCLNIADQDIVLVGKPQDQPEAVLHELNSRPLADTAVGVPDEEVVPHLEQALRQQQIPAFSPAGKPVSGHTLFHLLQCLGRLVEQHSYEAFSALARNPDFLHALKAENASFQTASFLADLDQIQNEHLPLTFSDLLDRCRDSDGTTLATGREELDTACTLACRLLHAMQVPDPAALRTVLQDLYSARLLTPDDPEDRDFAEVAACVAAELANLDSPAVASFCSDPGARLNLLLHVLRNQRYYPESPEPALDLDGWLELHWNDAPGLVITGFNEGRVPSSIVGHVFLPDQARARLGLLHNDQRLARDSYLLQAALASRADNGAVTLVVGKTTDAGDPLKPSRLLFRCPDTQLAQRAQALFREIQKSSRDLPRRFAWKLTPPSRPIRNRLPVTAFRDYLACPLRFYFRHVLRMTERNDRKTELDAADFGHVCHLALEAFGRDRTRRDETDSDAIAEFLTAKAAELVRDRYGAAPSAALCIQLDSIQQRLHGAAVVQAELRARGWRVQAVEYRLGAGHGTPFHGITISGVIDRIDEHEDGRRRLLDYKTFETPRTPEQEHLRNPPRNSLPAAEESAHAWSLCESGGKLRQWRDLQLPLYCLLLEQELGPVHECGYFILPKAASDASVQLWTNLQPEVLTAARNCAEAVVDRIRERRFWPPAEKVQYDDFERILLDSASTSVEPGPFTNL